MSRAVRRILFVCQGNICRSPVAEGVFNHLAKQEGVEGEIRADSAGTISFHSGEPPDQRMSEAAAAHGVTLSGAARQFIVPDFQRYDLILTMDSHNYRDVQSVAESAEEREKVKRFLSFDDASPQGASVPDPYYGGRKGFENVYLMVERTCKSILACHRAGRLF